MKQYFLNSLIIAALIIAAAFTGCKKDKPEIPEKNGPIAVNLRADIKPASILKVKNDQWEANDKVGLYMKRAGVDLTAAGAVYSNAANVEASLDATGNLVINPPLMYPLTGNVDFIAYHPYNSNVSAGYTIPVNVAGQATGLPTEVLYSNNITNQVAVSTPVKLDFMYSLAKIELTVTGFLLTSNSVN